MKNLLIVYIACESQQQAENIAEKLLKQRLAACVNIVHDVTSLYLWPPKKHTIETAKETLLMVKTLEPKWKQLEEVIYRLHTYKTPEIIAVPATHVAQVYYDWLVGELS